MLQKYIFFNNIIIKKHFYSIFTKKYYKNILFKLS
jgi:hypothetical protein